MRNADLRAGSTFGVSLKRTKGCCFFSSLLGKDVRGSLRLVLPLKEIKGDWGGERRGEEMSRFISF